MGFPTPLELNALHVVVNTAGYVEFNDLVTGESVKVSFEAVFRAAAETQEVLLNSNILLAEMIRGNAADVLEAAVKDFASRADEE